MATIKQLSKQIETANKRIADFTRKVEMYRGRTEKACAAANVSVDDIITKETVNGRYHSFDYVFPEEIQSRLDWEVSFRIRNNYTYMKENERNIVMEQRNIERLSQELAALQEKEEAKRNAFNTGLSKALNDSMQDFKKVWFDKMIAWHTNHHEFINAHKEEARATYNRARSLSYYFQWKRNHKRLFKSLEILCRCKCEIFTDEAANMDLASYLDECRKNLERTWNNGIITLTEKCQFFGVDESNITIASPAMTSKGFEVYITDGKPRRIYARIIWAAEYSTIVEPHTRYIVTEKKI